MAPLNKRMVTVYDADNKAHKVDNLNAIDMVTSLGYTYKPGRPYEPVDNAPHALKDLPTDIRGARKAQSILDAVGSNGGSPVIDEPIVIEETEDEAEIEAMLVEAEEAEEVPVVAPVAVFETTVQPSRGRPKKA